MASSSELSSTSILLPKAVDVTVQAERVCAIGSNASLVADGGRDLILVHSQETTENGPSTPFREGILRSHRVQVSRSSITTPHTAPIQSMVLLKRHNKILTISVDSSHGIVATQGDCENSRLSVSSSIVPSANHFPTGWAGISCDALNDNKCVSCCYLDKCVQFCDIEAGKIVSKASTMKSPTAIRHTENNIIVAEGGIFSVWDSRTPVCVFREPILNGKMPIWTICARDYSVLVAGADRNIYAYDNRTWRSRVKCSSPCKFDIVKLLPSSLSTSHFYVGGLDNEILQVEILSLQNESGTKDRETIGHPTKRLHADLPGGPVLPCSGSKLKESHEKGFRAESRWLGIDVIQTIDGNETLHGLCDNGKLYYLDNSQLMPSVRCNL
jgi:hypothetical protein